MVSRIGSGPGTGTLDLQLRCEPESGHSTVEKIVNVLYCDTMFTPKQIHERQPLKTAAFRKTLVAFDFDEKLIQNNYVTSRVKRISLPVFCGWSSAFIFRIWFGKQKNAISAKILN